MTPLQSSECITKGNEIAGTHCRNQGHTNTCRQEHGFAPSMFWESLRIEIVRDLDHPARAQLRLFLQNLALITVTSPSQGVCVALVPPSAYDGTKGNATQAEEGIVVKSLGWMRLISLPLLAVSAIPLTPQQGNAAEEQGQLRVIQVKQPDGQILSYGDLSRPTEVTLAGTSLAREAHLKLKIQNASSSSGFFFRKRRPGFVEIDINRGNIAGLQPPQQFGKDFLTYVLWAVSGDGKASNLGEITSGGQGSISINARTPYQSFWLMVTAEPDFAVVDPSPQVVLYSISEAGRKEGTEKKDGAEKKDPPKKGNLFFYTHYADYDSAPTGVEAAPTELLQARKAVELATRSGASRLENSSGAGETGGGSHTRGILTRAKSFLGQAESAYKKHPKGNNLVQPARTAAQIAENARALALGAGGGNSNRQLEDELARVRAELQATQAELAKANARSSPEDPKTSSLEASDPPTAPAPLAKPSAVRQLANIVSKPSVWFGLLGWGLAVLLLLRRQPS
jgi:hypothetical protein